jgi:hypothetical protein
MIGDRQGLIGRKTFASDRMHRPSNAIITKLSTRADSRAGPVRCLRRRIFAKYLGEMNDFQFRELLFGNYTSFNWNFTKPQKEDTHTYLRECCAVGAFWPAPLVRFRLVVPVLKVELMAKGRVWRSKMP